MKAFVLILILLSITPRRVAAQDDEERANQSKLVALERAWKTQGYAAKDLRTLDALLDPSFIGVDGRGRILDKTALLGSVQTTDSLHYVIDAVDVRMHGDSAIVTALYTQQWVKQGKLVVERGRFVDTWVQKDNRWVALASLSISMDDSN